MTKFTATVFNWDAYKKYQKTKKTKIVDVER